MHQSQARPEDGVNFHDHDADPFEVDGEVGAALRGLHEDAAERRVLVLYCEEEWATDVGDAANLEGAVVLGLDDDGLYLFINLGEGDSSGTVPHDSGTVTLNNVAGQELDVEFEFEEEGADEDSDREDDDEDGSACAATVISLSVQQDLDQARESRNPFAIGLSGGTGTLLDNDADEVDGLSEGLAAELARVHEDGGTVVVIYNASEYWTADSPNLFLAGATLLGWAGGSGEPDWLVFLISGDKATGTLVDTGAWEYTMTIAADSVVVAAADPDEEEEVREGEAGA